MHPFLRFDGSLARIFFLAGIAAGCSSEGSLAGSPSEGTGAAAGSGGSAGHGGVSGHTGGSSSAGTGGQADDDGGTDVEPDAGTDETPDADSTTEGSATTCTDAGPLPTYDGQLTLYDGPPVGPEVKMDCPDDPTVGFVEYKDTFHVERPYNVPINTRFKEDCGLYTFWVLPGDKPHSTTTAAKNPRTEARFSQNFTRGIRMWSADVMLEKNTNRSVIMQVHTTTTGIGPVYLHVEGDALAGSSIKSSDIPGGLFDNWFNMKVVINAATTESHIYINNCLKTTQKGTRGNGIDYFKNGVYHCSAPVCRDHYKNIHLYQQQ
jgi:hypothetical protein